jgi:DNA-binding MarR family transcriptional regulator
MPQLRALVVLSTGGASNLSGVAESLGVNPSNASRTCEQLVRRGLVDREVDPQDRRHVSLALSTAGRRLVQSVMQHRQQILEVVVGAMPSDDQHALMSALESFNAAAEAVGGPGPTSPESHRQMLRWLG